MTDSLYNITLITPLLTKEINYLTLNVDLNRIFIASANDTVRLANQNRVLK